MIRSTVRYLSEKNSCHRYKTMTQEESFRRSEENAYRLSEAVTMSNQASTARLPYRFRELYLMGCKAKSQNDLAAARRAFEKALEILPPSDEFKGKRILIEGEIGELSQSLRGDQLRSFMWKGIVIMTISTLAAFSFNRKQQQ